MLQNCDLDYTELRQYRIDDLFLSDYKNQRLINSFLFNSMKAQDKIGAKLFRLILFELKEINNFAVPMKDILNQLEKLRVLYAVEDWDRLREIRNILAHEYSDDTKSEIINIKIAMNGFQLLSKIFANINNYAKNNGLS